MSYLALAKQAQALIHAKASGFGIAIETDTLEGTALLVSLLRMPLDDFARRGAPLGVRVPWYDELLWFVPTQGEAVLLEREGIHRGRIWTAAELLGLLSVPGLTHEQIITVGRAKLEFTGEVVMRTSSPRNQAPHPAVPSNHANPPGKRRKVAGACQIRSVERSGDSERHRTRSPHDSRRAGRPRDARSSADTPHRGSGRARATGR